MVVRANVFGSPREDARSRDFTVNGMFYDPIAGEIIDYVNGREDIARRLLRSIGDAGTRLREDPVRMLRAIKFAARLGFDIDDDIRAASAETAPLVMTCPMARVSEEVFRILESGHAASAFELLEAYDLVDAMMPEVATAFASDDGARGLLMAWLEQLDRMVGAHGTPSRSAAFAFAAWPFIYPLIMRDESPYNVDWGRFARATIHDVAARLTIPVRHRQAVQTVANIFKRLTSPPGSRPHARAAALVGPAHRALHGARALPHRRHRAGPLRGVGRAGRGARDLGGALRAAQRGGRRARVGRIRPSQGRRGRSGGGDDDAKASRGGRDEGGGERKSGGRRRRRSGGGGRRPKPE